MAVLVVAEHDNKTVKKATLNPVAAAQKLGGEIHVLVAGHQAGEAAKAAAITVKRILVFIESVLQNVGETAVGWYGTVPVYVRLMDKSQGVGLRGV